MTATALALIGAGLVFFSGVVTGWTLARRVTGYMLGGRP